ncbi:Coronatine-insensitive protein 1 [Sarracenia purpurea var. burkii]
MEDGKMNTMIGGMPDTVFECVMNYIHDSRDRDAVSLVCRRWYEIDALTRKHVTKALCYTTTPQQLWRRFQHLESLKLKGTPRPVMFKLLPEDWGGDSDLELLAQSRGRALHVLKLDNCSGFSTDGLLHVGRFCKSLKTLFLGGSSIIEKDGEWLHELALNNTVLETLNFYMMDLVEVRFQDLELIARNCPSLVSVKINECELLDLAGFFSAAAALEEFGGGSFGEQPERYSSLSFPPKVRCCCLGLTYMEQNKIPILFPFASLLRRLDLLYTLLDTEDHCLLIQRCPNLEVLETRNVIGDRGLEILARCCKRLRRLWIVDDAEDEEGFVSHRGLIALAQGCPELECLDVNVSDITNASLEYIGTYLKNLYDFRLLLLDREERIADLPLDNGVRALLQGCKLRRFALDIRPGGLTDVGLGYIGQYSPNVRWMLLGSVGESDAGLLEFSRGCPRLQKLEIGDCCFSERALAMAALQLTSLRYLWVQGYRASSTAHDFFAVARPFWNIELMPARRVIVRNPPPILAYCCSLAGQRTDFPDTVIPLDADAVLNA